jgi:ABC-type glycerol-3-phosphate transport system permease component
MNRARIALSRRLRVRLQRGLLYVVAVGGSLVMMIPFIWAVLTSLKELPQIWRYPPEWIPRPVVWRNYIEAWTHQPFGLFLKNTSIITFVGLVGEILTSAAVAYGFARFRFPGRDVLFLVVLSTMMLPMQVTMIPIYLIMRALGWIDTFMPLIVPAYLGGGAFNIFLMRQFFMTIPLSLNEAARVEGCSSLRAFWSIMLPLCKPALAAVGVLGFIRRWNDFLYPLIYLNSKEKFTLALGLRFFQTMVGEDSLGLARIELLMAASVAVALPCVVLFFFAQRYFVSGIALSGMKQ